MKIERQRGILPESGINAKFTSHDVLCPGFAPNPFLCFCFGLGVFLFWSFFGWSECTPFFRSPEKGQRRRDDNKTNIFAFEGGGGPGGGLGGREERFFRGQRHDNKILNVQIFIVEKFCCHCAGSYFGRSECTPFCSSPENQHQRKGNNNNSKRHLM